VEGGTCGTYTILQLCEQAHWDVIGDGLCLSDWDPRAKAKEIRSHLKECPDCARWYRNARRAYEKLGDDVESVLPEPCFLTPPQPRVPILCQAADDKTVLIELKPNAGPGLLEKCTVHLKWEREGDQPVAPRWSVSVKLMSTETGNDEQTLKKLSGSSVLLERQVAGRPDSEHILTRLEFDAAKNLVSIAPRETEVADPKADLESTQFTLTLLDWGKETRSD